MAITWITGNSGSGKTTLARGVLEYDTTYNEGKHNDFTHPYYKPIWLDGDNMRGVWTDLKFSKEDRWEQNMRVARLAKMLEQQGHNIIVSLICPYKKLRAEVKKLTNCKFIYIEGGKEGERYPYDVPKLY